jgi:hypothetical protein
MNISLVQLKLTDPFNLLEPVWRQQAQKIVAANRLRLQVVPSLLEVPSQFEMKSTRALKFLLAWPIINNSMFYGLLRRNEWDLQYALQAAWRRPPPMPKHAQIKIEDGGDGHDLEAFVASWAE